MKEYDVIVVGFGAGAAIVDGALSHAMKMALVDKDPPGETYWNRIEFDFNSIVAIKLPIFSIIQTRRTRCEK